MAVGATCGTCSPASRRNALLISAVSRGVYGASFEPSSSYITFASGCASFISRRIFSEIDLALTERAVAEEVLTAAVVLEVHVDDDRQEVLDDLRGVGAGLLQLADVGRELHVAGVDRFHHRVDLVARVDGGAGVLVQAGLQAEIVERLAVIVRARRRCGARAALKSKVARSTPPALTTANVPPYLRVTLPQAITCAMLSFSFDGIVDVDAHERRAEGNRDAAPADRRACPCRRAPASPSPRFRSSDSRGCDMSARACARFSGVRGVAPQIRPVTPIFSRGAAAAMPRRGQRAGPGERERHRAAERPASRAGVESWSDALHGALSSSAHWHRLGAPQIRSCVLRKFQCVVC